MFTDGSKIDDEVGAGYLIACTEGEGERVTMKVAGPQTMNRSEMTAQHAVLQDAGHDTRLTIYTDSMCSIQKLQSWVRNPRSLDGDKHSKIIWDIATRIANRRGATYMRKVPAHVALKWNEAANKTAKHAAKTEESQTDKRRGLDRPQATNVYTPVYQDTVVERKAQIITGIMEWVANKYSYAKGEDSLHHL